MCIQRALAAGAAREAPSAGGSYNILYYTIQYYTMLYYTIIYYTML